MNVPLFRFEYSAEEAEAITNVLRSGQLSRGSAPRQFEKKLNQYLGCENGVVLGSGTAALHLALASLQLPRDSEVILPSLSFVATAFCVEYCGLKPVFADVHLDDFTMAPASVGAKVTGKTKAIIAMHYGGRACDMKSIQEIARRNDLVLIEDAAHAIGAKYRTGERIGSCAYSHVTCFSFFATKNITAAEGGYASTSHAKLAQRMRLAKAHGIEPLKDGPSASGYYDVASLGFNYHLNNLSIALLDSQLTKLDDLNQRRNENAQYLTSLLNDVPGIFCPYYHDTAGHVYHLYTIRLDPSVLRVSRDEVVAALLSKGIQVGVYYPPIHLLKYFRDKYGYKRGFLTNTETIGDTIITLPMYPSLMKEEIEAVAEGLRDAIKYHNI